MPAYNVSAIILRRINFGETDRIVTLYTRERGKLSGIAKGARKPISRLGGATEPLSYARLQLATGKTLEVITQAEVRDSFPRVRADLIRTAYGMYLLELVDRFTEEHEVSTDTFELLLSALYLLERPNDPAKIARMFELQLMTLLGYEPTLDRCLRCLAALPPDDVCFSPSLGGVVCRECGALPEDALQVSHQAVELMQKLATAEASEVERMDASPETLDQIERAMRWHIRYRAEGELRSLDFLQTLKDGCAIEKPELA